MTSADIRSAFLNFFASKGHQIVASSSLVPHEDPTLLFTNAGMNQFKDVFLGFDRRSYNRATTSQKCVRAGGKHNDLENVGYTARHHTFFEMLGNFSFGDYFKQDAIDYAWELLTGVFKLPADKLWVTVYAEDDEAYAIWRDRIGVPVERIVRIGDNKGARYASDNFWMMGDTGPCGPCTEIFYDHGEGIPGGPPGSPDEDGDRYIEIWNNVFMQYNRDEAGVLHPLPKPSVDTGMGLERIAAVLQQVHSNYEIDLFVALIAAAARETHTTGLDNPSLKVLADHIRACSFLIADGVIPGNEGRGYVLRRIIRRAIRHGYKLGARAAFFHRMVPDLVAQMGSAYPDLATAQNRVSDVLRQEEERFFTTIAGGMSILESAIAEEYFTVKWLTEKTGKEANEVHIVGIAGRYSYQFDCLLANSGTCVPVNVVFAKRLDQKTLDKLFSNLYAIQESLFAEYDNLHLVIVTERENEGIPSQLQSLMQGSNITIEVTRVTEKELQPYRTLRGDVAFKLHDTYGFPLDLTADICRERGVTVDTAGFDAAMARQKDQARAAGKFKMASALEYDDTTTVFRGYDTLAVDDARVVALYKDGTPVASLTEGEQGVVVLDRTPFYAESGGQVGDRGELLSPSPASAGEGRGEGAFPADQTRPALTPDPSPADAALTPNPSPASAGEGGVCFIVEDTLKIQAAVFGHHGKLKAGELTVGDTVSARVDVRARAATARNHSVTHLMHKALREVLGEHVAQKGSLVDGDKTRFDFVQHAPMTDDEIARVERIVNTEILANAATQARVMSIEDAQKTGAMMLFGEKYGDEVRVLDIGSSRELCGGTHVARTGDIGLFKITVEAGVAAGVRRVEAITGENAVAFVQGQDRLVAQAAAAFKAPPAELPAKIAQTLDHVRTLEKELARLKSKLASSQGDDLAAQAVTIGSAKVLAAVMEGADVPALRETLDKLRDKLGSAAIVLAAVNDGKVSLIAGVTPDLTVKVKAGELVNFVAAQVGGKGGGKPDMAQAGGTQPENLAVALAGVAKWVEGRL
ncbi:alanine--tRNA ligase [Methyloversatilis sp.]|uniref:alanine--tRNA ligase n=1 Tax=Methyloversatilis sp. TaxID=2569862 RepID=UPI0027355A35|nr:alanine--tRNA ligase [Methyloversatilis sp.]MDP3456929.1 alanine--tRNA ligase [Methyloversatilis sp.]